MERTAVTLSSPPADGGISAARAETDLAVGQIYTLDLQDTLSLEAGTVIFTTGDGSDGQTVIGSAGAGDFAIGGSRVVELVGQAATVSAAISVRSEGDAFFDAMLAEMDARIDEVTARTDKLLSRYA